MQGSKVSMLGLTTKVIVMLGVIFLQRAGLAMDAGVTWGTGVAVGLVLYGRFKSNSSDNQHPNWASQPTDGESAAQPRHDARVMRKAWHNLGRR